MVATPSPFQSILSRVLTPVRNNMPILRWGPTYTREKLSNDLIAAVIVTIMLIPQSLAYALLAGLPPEIGIYASILPLVAYTLFGTSRALAVGPTAVTSLMTASAVGSLAATGVIDVATAALLLAFISGVVLILLGALRLGLLANFLSHPVISGFMTASGILIAVSQLKHIFGLKTEGETLYELLPMLYAQIGQIKIPTLLVGVSVIAFLYWSRTKLKPLLRNAGWSARSADVATKAAPVAAVLSTTLITWLFSLHSKGVAIVGTLPQGLPPLTMPSLDPKLWSELALSAVLISVIGFVESISVAHTFAAKRRERISPDQELIGLGAANIAASVTGGFPVTGGFSRSVVNYEAGAETPAAGAFTAVGILFAALFLAPYLYFLPKATLAATIIVAVLTLVDFGALKRTWTYSHCDFSAMAATIVVTLAFGVEAGVTAGVCLSVMQHLWRTSRPQYAVVGLMRGTQFFRNEARHEVITSDRVLIVRIDESLYFPNARFLEDTITNLVAARPSVEHVVLKCSAVNHIDASAVESLEAINRHLHDSNVLFHLSELKGPVKDRLKRSHFLQDLTGGVYLSQYEAMRALAPEMLDDTGDIAREETATASASGDRQPALS